jgi:hypothetical protein
MMFCEAFRVRTLKLLLVGFIRSAKPAVLLHFQLLLILVLVPQYKYKYLFVLLRVIVRLATTSDSE